MNSEVGQWIGRFPNGLAWAVAAAVALTACSGRSGEDNLASGRNHLSKQEPKTAIIEFKSYLADHPDSAEGRFLLGKAFFESGDSQKAEVELRKALDLKYPADSVVPMLARVLLQNGQPKKVIDELARLPMGDKRATADLQTSVAVAHARQGQRKLADDAVSQALAADPTFAPAQIARARTLATDGNPQQALQIVDAVLAGDAHNADAWQAKGDLLLHGLQDRDKALEAYARAVAEKPDLLTARFATIEILLARRDVAGARRELEAVRKIAPQLPQVKFVEAELAFIDEDYAKARSLTQQLLLVAPESVRLLVLDAAINLQLQAYVLAEGSAAKAVSLDARSPVARQMLAQVHLRSGQYTKTMTDLAPLLQAPQPDAATLALAAEAYLQAGKPDKVEELYSRASQTGPVDVGVRIPAALARLAKGDRERAFAELGEVAAKDSGDTADLAIIGARLHRREFDAALKAIKSLQAKQPKRALPVDLEGRVLLARGDRAAARKTFEHAVELEPNFFPAVADLAKLDVADKDVGAARKRLEALLKAKPDNSDAKMALAELRIHEKAPKAEVAKLLTDLIAADPYFAPARLKLIELHIANFAPRQAVTVAQEAVAFQSGNPDFIDALGRAQLAAGDGSQAISTFGKLVERLPDRPRAYARLADAQLAVGDRAGALVTLRRGLDVVPDDVDLSQRLMRISLKAHQADKALSYARALQARQPQRAVGYLAEADIQAAQGNWPATIAALRTALARAPAQGRATTLRLYAALVSAGKPDEAQGLVGSWLKDHPQDSGFLVDLGNLMLARKDYAQAEARYEAALKLRPDDASALNNLAWSMLKQQKKGALPYAQRAAQLAPDSAVVLDTHAMALAGEGRLGDAIEVSKKALALDPDADAARLNLARWYAGSGKPELARAELDRLVALGSKFDGAADAKQLLATLPPR